MQVRDQRDQLVHTAVGVYDEHGTVDSWWPTMAEAKAHVRALDETDESRTISVIKGER